MFGNDDITAFISHLHNFIQHRCVTHLYFLIQYSAYTCSVFSKEQAFKTCFINRYVMQVSVFSIACATCMFLNKPGVQNATEQCRHEKQLPVT